MPLIAYCQERFRITVSLGPGTGKRQKTGSNRKNIGERSKPSAFFLLLLFFFVSPTPIFSPFPHNAEPGHRLDYSQTKKTVNTRNISRMLLCC